MKYFDTKIEIHSKEESILVQKTLFAEGYKWRDGCKNLQYFDAKHLFIYANGNILMCMNDEPHFNSHENKQIFISDFLNKENYEIF